MIGMRTALGALSVATLAAVALAGLVREAVHGKLQPTDDTSRARGVFKMASTTRDSGHSNERMEVACNKLDATEDDQGHLPDYHLVLTSGDGNTTADFGSLTLTRRGAGGLRWDAKRSGYPDGVETLTAFGGGTMSVVLGDSTVLTGAIPEFAGPGGDPGQGARGVRRDANRLDPATTGSNAHGVIEARYANTGHGTNEQLRVHVEGLSKDGKPYTAYVLDGEGGETSLGAMSPHGRFGVADVAYDTRRGDTIPGGGSVTGFANLDVEVRDNAGNVVMTGKFPDVTIE